MKVSQFLEILDSISPFKLAQDWDNVGLLIGDENAKVSKVIFTIDITQAVVDEAKSLKAKTIVSYHPVIWEPLKKITARGEKPIVYKLLKDGFNVISIHTALDAACGGVNDGLAKAIGLINTEPISDFVSLSNEKMYKLVVFVPTDNVNLVSKAIFDAGAGRLGNYSNCGFSGEGVGTFLPLKGATPAIGKRGRQESVDEVRFETIVRERNLVGVIEAMKRAHPYEMPAFDVIKLETEEKKYGIGRLGSFEAEKEIGIIVGEIKKLTGAKVIGFVGEAKRRVKSAAVCAGSCGSIITKVIAAGCELYITGELKHHDALLARESGLSCLCLSHSVSERFILAELAERIKISCPSLDLMLSKEDTEPFSWRQI